MDWLRLATIVSLLAVAIAAGGSLVRLAIGLGDLRAAAVIGLVGLVLLGSIASGARGRRWRQNPYW
jgi:hypothetical protein